MFQQLDGGAIEPLEVVDEERFAGIDPLTAYLATSPGGADSAAIIAASSGKADMLFVMTLQMIRAITTILVGPQLARLIARRMGEGPSAGSAKK